MAKKPTPEHATAEPEFAEEGAVLTFDEICNFCQVDADWVVELVEHGAIEPIGRARSDWQFTRLSYLRIARAKRLERDLALNPPGVALALDLLDEIEELRSQLWSHRLRRVPPLTKRQARPASHRGEL